MVVDRQKLMIGGAAGVLLVVLAWVWWPASQPAPGSAAAPARAQRAPAAKNTAAPAGPVSVKLDRLASKGDEPGSAERNPFRYKPKPAPPPPPRPVAPPVTDAPRITPPVPTGPPPPAPIPLKLIGVLTRENGVKWAVLSDGKSAPMYGKDGDIIDGRYAIVKIGTESIEMTYADGRGRQVIRLSGQ
jgi:hypothetical protein